jgi:hypothetical protein
MVATKVPWGRALWECGFPSNGGRKFTGDGLALSRRRKTVAAGGNTAFRRPAEGAIRAFCDGASKKWRRSE